MKLQGIGPLIDLRSAIVNVKRKCIFARNIVCNWSIEERLFLPGIEVKEQ